jgi:hypothetical protein
MAAVIPGNWTQPLAMALAKVDDVGDPIAALKNDTFWSLEADFGKSTDAKYSYSRTGDLPNFNLLSVPQLTAAGLSVKFVNEHAIVMGPGEVSLLSATRHPTSDLYLLASSGRFGREW